MAVKASATITLTSYRDTQSVTRYYKLQTAGSSAPLKPDTKPPSSDWTDSEPACDISKELYFCDLTIFSNGDGEYSKVSKSSSYEAAKQAFNRAQAAKDSIDNLEIGGRNVLLRTKDFSSEKWYIKGISTPVLDDDGFYYCGILHTWENYIHQSALLELNEVYTCSFYAKADSVVQLEIKDDSTNNEVLKYISITSTEWQRYTCTFTKHINNSTTSDVAFLTRQANTTIYIKKIKIEKGNKATDWTPAPEDVDAGIDEAQSNALTAQEEASALDEDLNDFKSNEYSQINDKVGELVEYKGENEKEIGKIREELSQELVAQKFARIEPDKGSLILGEINGTTAVLTNEQFGFYTPNSEIAAAYFGKDNDAWAFNIERGIIKNDLRFSGFQWIARSNKNMSLKWLK